jgi:hypothetical protein
MLEIRASEEDVRSYLEGYMFWLPGFVGQSLELQEEIKTNIVKTIDGMYVVYLSINRIMLSLLGFCLHSSILNL